MGASLPPYAAPNTPEIEDIRIGVATTVSGTINVGDFLVYSGHAVLATALGNPFSGRASAAGIAMEASPVYDSHGVQRTNTALLFMREGIWRASAHNNVLASGDVPLGTPVYPATTGSGVAAPTGLTGVGAQWATGAKVMPGASGATGMGIYSVVGLRKLGSGSGNSEIAILVTPPSPAYF